jgi:hypothetical protein
MTLTNSYCENIDRAKTHHQRKCALCGLWTIWSHKKTGEGVKDCDCGGGSNGE